MKRTPDKQLTTDESAMDRAWSCGRNPNGPGLRLLRSLSELCSIERNSSSKRMRLSKSEDLRVITFCEVCCVAVLVDRESADVQATAAAITDVLGEAASVPRGRAA